MNLLILVLIFFIINKKVKNKTIDFTVFGKVLKTLLANVKKNLDLLQ